MFASLGSRIDVGYGDLIDFLTYHYNTRSIVIYMETVGNAKRFISAARGFALSKPIVVLKPGRSEAVREFIDMRAGRQTGNDRVYDAVFRRVGIVRVAEVMDLFNMATVLDSPRLPGGPRLAVITNAGDMGIMATDKLTELGGKLAMISAEGRDKQDVLLPEQWYRDDPVDMEGEADTRRYMNTVEACLRDEGVDGILVIYTPRVFAGAVDLAQAIIEMSRKTQKPVIVAWIGGERAAEGRRILMHNNVPAYATPEEAVKTYLYMYGYHRNIELIYETPAEDVKAGAPLMNYLKTVVRKAMKEGRHTLPGQHALDLLRNYRIDTPSTAVVTDINQVRREIRQMGLPQSLTMRYFYEDKEEIIPLTKEEDIDDACRESKQKFGVENVEIILQKQPGANSFRLKLESRRDPEFRTVLVLSSDVGGPDNICIGLPPLNQTLARRLLEGMDIYRALKDSEEEQQTVSRLEYALLSFSNLVVDFSEIESISLVLWVGESKVLAGDVKVVLARDYDDSTSYPHLVITPYPSRYMTNWSLPNGTEVLIRPIRPEDKFMYQEMLAELSEETVRNRYFGVREISDDLVVRSCNMDYDRELAVLAEIKKNEKKIMIGGSRLIYEPDTRIGEFAIIVRDNYQGMGLGAKLIDVLIGIGREKQLDEIEGLVLTDNEKMLALCRKLGFRVKPEPEGVSRVSLSLEN
jgi:acetyltransferase